MSSISSLSLPRFSVEFKLHRSLTCTERFPSGQALGEIMAKFFVNPTLLRVVRVARVGRVLRLVKGLWTRACLRLRKSRCTVFQEQRVFEHCCSLWPCPCQRSSILVSYFFWSCLSIQSLACPSLPTFVNLLVSRTYLISKHSRIRSSFSFKCVQAPAGRVFSKRWQMIDRPIVIQRSSYRRVEVIAETLLLLYHFSSVIWSSVLSSW